MSNATFGFLRTPRHAAEIVLGLDGRALAPDSPEFAAATSREAVEAVDIVSRAQEQARAIVEQAQEAVAAAQHEAYGEGRERGYADGMLGARGELADALALVQRVGAEARVVRDRLLWSAEREMIELVIDVAASVLGAQVAIDPALVLETVDRALTRAGAQNVLRVRVHPDDRSIVVAKMTEHHGDTLPFAVIDDHTVAVGGCIVDTQAGEVDARLDVQLDEIARLLRESIPDGRTGPEVADA